VDFAEAVSQAHGVVAVWNGYCSDSSSVAWASSEAAAASAVAVAAVEVEVAGKATLQAEVAGTVRLAVVGTGFDSVLVAVDSRSDMEVLVLPAGGCNCRDSAAVAVEVAVDLRG